MAMKLLELIDPACVVADLAADDRPGVVRDLVGRLATCGHLASEQVDAVVKSILNRERARGTTGIGKGVALPHVKLTGLPRVVCAVGRSVRGVDFAALDGEPVFGVFLVLSPEEKPEEHLRAMDLVFRHLQQDRFRRFFRQAETTQKLLDLMRDADEKLLSA